MQVEFLGNNTLQKFDDLLVNLIGLRADLIYLPDFVVFQILKRAQVDLKSIVEGFRCGLDIEALK